MIEIGKLYKCIFDTFTYSDDLDFDLLNKLVIPLRIEGKMIFVYSVEDGKFQKRHLYDDELELLE